MKMCYLSLDVHQKIVHGSVGADVLLGIDPLAEEAYFSYESELQRYNVFYTGEREKIDLVTMERESRRGLSGLEIKLTALPDNTTKNLTPEEYGCEIVVRPPTICFLACSICDKYEGAIGRSQLRDLLGNVPQIKHWEDAENVLPHYLEIEEALRRVSSAVRLRQQPLIVQPVWKSLGAQMRLADDCLDVFVWSNLALLMLCCGQEKSQATISRHMRTVIWVYRMLFDYAVYGQFDYVRIIKLHSYSYANDKAFALSGRATNAVMRCHELLHPRISKGEIKNIILGNGQILLGPERRFDAVIVNSPELFE